ncbi:interleukin 17 receptor A1a isoform X2 [Dunckerocampus dactyliophorus]|uniref:interleukin 17 receptor A1a isoform X2 n=1 Tax=Dunckerocampus dactyliophorus TaxID=161453 RepID=UPI002406634B|nr:interleukin 17 receptor A1a isoform X2 [Dunckerocampus dactyliophorus]
MGLYGVFLALFYVSLSSAVRILTSPPLNCSQQGLRCTVSLSKCFDKEWLKVKEYTPSSPEDLKVSMTTIDDEAGQLQPVLAVNWTIKDDGSIRYLIATELQLIVFSTNEHLCVRYSFKDRLPMRNPYGNKWSFSANMLVLDPGHMYLVSVFNIPKPEMGHSHYDVHAQVEVPDCQDSVMKITQFCIERGSLWQSNISVVAKRPALTVSFCPDPLCEEYTVIVNCASIQNVDHVFKANQTNLNVTFSLDKWPKSCCQFDVGIKPMFQQCGQDCARHQKTLHICPGTPGVAVGDEKPKQLPKPLQQTPKVLVIYSQDHRLYRDIVLKLCAFLQAKCGAKVLIDLLDANSLGMVGRLPWLEWQRRQLKNPTDKILVLCSPGVQAKWRAMCGHSRVTLKEDLLSPTNDMLTPSLNLFLQDIHQARMHGKYMVAYFSDISGEQDVPSVFDIAVKYKLMRHFEELFFGILDMEKYQPGLVNRIEGISGDEYFNCPSGLALKNAIETFQAYQLEHPDWFERECVHSDEELVSEASLLIDKQQGPPILECLPLMRDGPSVCVCEAQIRENGSSVQVLTPELNPKSMLPPVAELIPEVNPVYPLNLSYACPSSSPQSVLLAEPVSSGQKWRTCAVRHQGQVPVEDEEEQPSGLQDSNPPCPSMECSPLNPISQSVEMRGDKIVELNSGSDQGYISKVPSPLGAAYKEDPLVALARLQEELFLQTMDSSDSGSQ